MKNNTTIFSYFGTFVFLCFFLFCGQTTNAQNYKPFPTSNAMWREYAGTILKTIHMRSINT